MSFLFIYASLLRFIKIIQGSDNGVITDKPDCNPDDDAAQQAQ